MNKSFISFLLVGFFLVLPGVAGAQTVQDMENKLAQQKREKEVLERQAGEVEGELKKTKSTLIDTSSNIQKAETRLKGLETKISEMESRKKVLVTELERDRLSTARLLMALERLRRVPPEAMMARPGAPLEAAQSSMLLRQIIPVLTRQTQELQAKVAELNTVTEGLREKHNETSKVTEKLAGQQKKLSGDVEKREQLFAALNHDLQENQERTKQIAKEAQNLQDLVRRLDNERTASSAGKRSKVKQAKMPKPGNGRLPVAGVISIAYGAPDAFSAPSQGLTIESRSKALVVSPMGGVVRFAGTFKNYGQMVIVEHSNGYHSLIAGLQKIDTVVGQSVSAGEPLGLLGGGNKPRLYYELRRNGQPVNPASVLGNLG